MQTNEERKRGEILLTPGPLTTSVTVRKALNRDIGSRDKTFIEMTARVRSKLCKLAGAEEGYNCIPIQGSGTFAVEATLGTLLPRRMGKCLILINGVYGERMAKICDYLGRAYEVYKTPEDIQPDPCEIASRLETNTDITHVAVVHCETTSGILNPIENIASIVRNAKREMIIDAMSSFGALKINLKKIPATALISSSNKCLQSVPGIAYAIIKTNILNTTAGNANSLCLDLHDQAKYLDKTGQWRFTPPTHVLAALDQALVELENEGGVSARETRYQANCNQLVDGLRLLGFNLFLSKMQQSPIIVTVRFPKNPNFDFEMMYEALRKKGVILYPGAVTQEKTFRIGCIGDINKTDIDRALSEISIYLASIGLNSKNLNRT
tara:strand:- start:8988 stop:10130 length:1143 start_codon:yes stop_codon:yes gene_type:complete